MKSRKLQNVNLIVLVGLNLKNKRRGFTLIELLVVIAIIALLVSILLPSLNKAKDIAKGVVCMSNLKACSTNFAFYHQDYDNTWPYTDGMYSNVPVTPDWKSWDKKLDEYAEGEIGYLACPSDEEKRLDRDEDGNAEPARSYVMNNRWHVVNGANRYGIINVKTEEINKPDQIVALSENHFKENYVHAWRFSLVGAFMGSYHGDKYQDNNVLFADYHVGPVEVMPEWIWPNPPNLSNEYFLTNN